MKVALLSPTRSLDRSRGAIRNFFLIDAMHRAEVATRDPVPLGDPAWKDPLPKVA